MRSLAIRGGCVAWSCQDEAGGDGPSQGSQAFASAVRVLVGSGEYLGSSPERQSADRCVIEELDRLEPARPAVAPTRAAYVDAQARSSVQRRPVAAVGRVQPGRRVVRRRRPASGGRQRRDLAGQRVPAGRGAPRTPPAARRTARARAVCEVRDPAARRRRPRRARPRASSAARRARSSAPAPAAAGASPGAGSRRGHRRQQPGEGAALGPAGGVARRAWSCAFARSDRTRCAADGSAGRGAGGLATRSPSRTSVGAVGVQQRERPSGGALDRRAAEHGDGGAELASTSSTRASSGVARVPGRPTARRRRRGRVVLPEVVAGVAAGREDRRGDPAEAPSAVRRRTSGRSGSTARPYPGRRPSGYRESEQLQHHHNQHHTTAQEVAAVARQQDAVRDRIEQELATPWAPSASTSRRWS